MHLCEYVVVAAGDLNARWTVQSEQLAANWMGILHLCLQGWKPEDSASEAYLVTLLQGLLLIITHLICWNPLGILFIGSTVLKFAAFFTDWHFRECVGCRLNRKSEKLMLKFSRGRRRRSSLTDLNLESLDEVLWCSTTTLGLDRNRLGHVLRTSL